MDLVFAVLIVWAVATTFLTPIVMRRPVQKKRYELMDDRKLIERNVEMKMMCSRLRWTGYLVALLLSPLLFALTPSLRTSVMLFMLLIIFGSRSCLTLFREIEQLTTTEIEFRKFKTQKEAPNQVPDNIDTNAPHSQH